jgi:hypothetical protein
MGLICHKDKNCKDWKRKMLNIILVIKCVLYLIVFPGVSVTLFTNALLLY